MASRVSVYIRIVRPDGSTTYAKPVFTTNGRLRGQYAFVGKEPKHHPEGVYYLRYHLNGKRTWHKVGANAAEAMNAKAVQEHLLKGAALGLADPTKSSASAPLSANPHALLAAKPEANAQVRWESAYRDYLLEVESRRSRRTARLYRSALDEFARACPVTYLHEITRSHFLRLEAYVVGKGNERRTAFNHATAMVTFLNRFGFRQVIEKRDLPRYTKKMPVAYSQRELKALLEAATPDDKLLFEYFLNTGFRDQEVMVSTMRDVDFDSGLIRVRSKPGYKFDPKDREEREVPVPDTLLAKLRERFARESDSPLIFPNRKGEPQKHMIRRLKRTALAAGLNCGECVSKKGEPCATHPVCERWQLHSFRRTFATWHHESGKVSIRVLADWLGHAEIDTTLGYLAVSNRRSEAVRSAVNSSFLSLVS